MAPSLAANANRWSRDLQPVRPTFDSKYIFSNPNCFVLFCFLIVFVCLFVIVFVRFYAMVLMGDSLLFYLNYENPVGLPDDKLTIRTKCLFIGPILMVIWQNLDQTTLLILIM